MERRIPGSERTRETLSELIEGRLSAPDAGSGPVRPATRLTAGETLEAESRDDPGRRLLRARRRSGAGIPQRLPDRADEDGRGGCGIHGAADRGAERSVPLKDPARAEEEQRGAAESGR